MCGFVPGAVGGDRDPPAKKGGGGVADWVIAGLQCVRKSLEQTY